MKSNNNLHRLIRSLNKAEKRHFKMMISQHVKKDSSNYVLLFDAIDRQEEYDESKLKQKFRKHHFGKNISKTKYMLYRQVLKSLRLLNDAKTPKALVHSYLNSVSTLFSKCLYEQCEALLVKARVVAKEQQYFDLLLDICNWEERLLPYLGLSPLAKYEELSKLRSQLQSQLCAESNLRSYWAQALRMENFSEEQQRLEWSRLMGRPELQLPQSETSFLSKVFFLCIHGLHAQHQGKPKATAQLLEQLFSLWHQHPEYINGREEEYIFSCAPFVLAGAGYPDLAKHYDELFRHLQDLGTPSHQSAKKVQCMALVLEFIYSIASRQIERCKILLMSIETLLLQNVQVLPVEWQLRLYYHIGIYFFLVGKYAEAVEWIEKVEQEASQETHPVMLNYCKLIGL
ncbi:MAG: hypothetical protein AAFV25_23645, partial [Bacteroidota bacterium]